MTKTLGHFGINHGSFRLRPGSRSQACWSDIAFAENVKDILPGGDEIVGNDTTMAAPPDGLGAHDDGVGPMSHLTQLFEPLSELLAQGVISEIVETHILLESVDVRRDVALNAAQTP